MSAYACPIPVNLIKYPHLCVSLYRQQKKPETNYFACEGKYITYKGDTLKRNYRNIAKTNYIIKPTMWFFFARCPTFIYSHLYYSLSIPRSIILWNDLKVSYFLSDRKSTQLNQTWQIQNYNSRGTYIFKHISTVTDLSCIAQQNTAQYSEFSTQNCIHTEI